MNIRQLKQFIAIARAGTISRAATSQNISQPALTRSLKNLEADLGVELLERRANGVFLTSYGEHLLQYAQCMVSDAERVRQEITAMQQGLRGRLNVGVGPAFSTRLLPKALQRLTTDGAQLEIKLRESFVEDLCAQLRSGELDVVLSLFPDTLETDDLEFAQLCTVDSVVVAASDHPLANIRQLTRQQLAQCNWVIADQVHANHSFREYLNRCTVPQHVQHVRANSLRLIKSLVVGSSYLSILPTMLIEEELRLGQIKRLNAPVRSLVSMGGMAWRKSGHRSAALREFVDIVKQEAKASQNFSASINTGQAPPPECELETVVADIPRNL